jgi:hypothetical protein
MIPRLPSLARPGPWPRRSGGRLSSDGLGRPGRASTPWRSQGINLNTVEIRRAEPCCEVVKGREANLACPLR